MELVFVEKWDKESEDYVSQEEEVDEDIEYLPVEVGFLVEAELKGEVDGDINLERGC